MAKKRGGETKRPKEEKPKAEKLFTLTEVAKKTGISLPTLQRYKKQYQDRIPSVGEGRKQRYPKAALTAVKRIKQENLKRRGRPKKAKKRPSGERKLAQRRARPRKAKKSQAGRAPRRVEMLSLSEIGRRTGISYPTLLRYVKQHRDEIPHRGQGRRRRFPPEAIRVFESLRKRSRRGRPRGKAAAEGARQVEVSSRALGRRIQQLEKAQREISQQLESVIKLLKKPVRVTISSD